MPKTYRNLWPQLVSFENLWLAYLAARRGKRSRRGVASYDFDTELRLLRLQERLESGAYAPGGYRTFVIREWKRRVISAAPFEDRIVHHALCRVIEPIWEARFIHDSFACRRGKGTLAALYRAQHFARGHRHVLPIDIRAFFPSMDHAILMRTDAEQEPSRQRHRQRQQRVAGSVGPSIASGPPKEPAARDPAGRRSTASERRRAVAHRAEEPTPLRRASRGCRHRAADTNVRRSGTSPRRSG